MLILGLTGSVGMGKSTVGGMFKRLGIPVFDADGAVHRLFELPCVRDAILKTFPAARYRDGIDRDRLGATVFADPAELSKLEKLLHPHVLRLQERFLRSYRRRNRSLVVLDIPLLFETGADLSCDLVAVVSAGPRIQRERVLSRRGMTETKFRDILARQMADAEKCSRADIVIRTDRPKRVTFRRVAALSRLLSRNPQGR